MAEQNTTELAVAIGRLEEGMKHVISGLDEIKSAQANQSARISSVEVKAEGIGNDVTRIRNELDQATARKPPWTAIAAIVIAGASAVKAYFGI